MPIGQDKVNAPSMVNNLKLSVVEIGTRHFLRFDFEGELTTEIAEAGIQKWHTEVMKLKNGEKVNVIYNCQQMSGFETGARKKWQEAMKTYKPHIQDIWIVSGSMLILGAAKTMGLLTGYTIKTCRTIEEIGR
jgi:hypothetical protein